MGFLSRVLSNLFREERGKHGKTYRGCSQCVIAALQDTLSARNGDIFKAATGLAGGTGLTGDIGCRVYTEPSKKISKNFLKILTFFV